MNSRVRSNALSLPAESTSKKVKLNSIKRQIDVYCRFRPISKTDKRCDYYNLVTDTNTIELNAPDEIIKKNQHIKKYNFTKVYDEESLQEQVYEDTVRELLVQLLTTRTNGLVFTYGVTNAGKTHTTIGSKGSLGILPRLLGDLMDYKSILRQGKSLECMAECAQPVDLKVHFECFEIYNEDIFDLNPDCKKGGPQKITERPKLRLKEGQYQTIWVENLNKVELSTIEESTEVIEKSLKNRQVASTALNASSSRSHTIFKVSVELISESRDSQQQATSNVGYICVVDLAGSERAKRTENNDNKLKEAGGINNSLMVLGRCLQSIKKGVVVPFRDCKLTKFLAEYFKVESNIKMITNINPREEDFQESLRVLNYASIAKEVTFIQSSFKAMRMEANKTRASIGGKISTGSTMEVEGNGPTGGGRDGGRYHTPMISRRRMGQGIDTEGEKRPFVFDQDKLETSLRETMENLLHQLMKDVKVETMNVVKATLNQMLIGSNKPKNNIQFKRGFTSEGGSPTTKQTSLFAGSNSDYIEQIVHKPMTRTAGTMVSKSLIENNRKRGRPKTRRTDGCYSEDDHRPSHHKVAYIKVSPRPPAESQLSPELKQKQQRSSFYTSLMKQPPLTLKRIEEISRQQYLKEQKDQYMFLLDICGKDFDEADKYYRNEYNETPPRLTSEEKRRALDD